MCGINFLNFVWFCKKNWFSSEWVGSVQFENKCGAVWILVIYYFCNSWVPVVNLQQILQHFCHVEWTVHTRLWYCSQCQLCFKTFFIRTLNASKVSFCLLKPNGYLVFRTFLLTDSYSFCVYFRYLFFYLSYNFSLLIMSFICLIIATGCNVRSSWENCLIWIIVHHLLSLKLLCQSSSCYNFHISSTSLPPCIKHYCLPVIYTY